MMVFTVAVYVAGAHWTEPPRRAYLKWADWFANAGDQYHPPKNPPSGECSAGPWWFNP